MGINGWGVLEAASYSPLIKEGPRWSEHHEIRVGPGVCGVKWELQAQGIRENLKPPFHSVWRTKRTKENESGALKKNQTLP